MLAQDRSLAHIFCEELANLDPAEVQQVVHVALQLQGAESRRGTDLGGHVHGDVQVHGVHDENVEVLALTHQQIGQVGYKILLEVGKLQGQHPNLYVHVVLANAGPHLEEPAQVVLARELSLR